MTVVTMTPRKPTFAELAADAIDGDPDAALELARRAPAAGFLSFLKKWVPEGEMTTLAFDTLSDSYHRMEMEREAQTSSL